MIKALFAAPLLILSAEAATQEEPAGFNPLDISRMLRAETRAAAGDEDFEAGRRTNNAALALQPGHPGLLSNEILLAGMAGDIEGQIAALEAIARTGLIFDVDTLDALPALRAAAPNRLEAVTARLAANAAPIGRAERLATVDLRDALIEAVEIDIETERLFLGGVAQRTIWVVEHGGETPRVFANMSDGLFSVFGLAVDSRNRLLYAATGTVPQTPLEAGEDPGTALMAFDLVTGDLMVRHEIEGARRIADLTVRDGIVYASDAEGRRVYRLADPLSELEVFAQDERFSSLQGVALMAGSIWLADYASGLWRVDPATGAARLARPPASGESLIGLDGLAAGPDGAIYAVRNGAAPMGVLKITLDGEGRLADAEPVLTSHRAFEGGEPTTLQIADGRAFLLANAQWALFPEDGSGPDGDRAPTAILTWPID